MRGNGIQEVNCRLVSFSLVRSREVWNLDADDTACCHSAPNSSFYRRDFLWCPCTDLRQHGIVAHALLGLG